MGKPGTGTRSFAELPVPPPRRLDRFEKTNEMLLNFNNLSSVRMQQMNERFLHHTRTLVEMKKDLDSIFRRIRWETGWERAGRWLGGSRGVKVGHRLEFWGVMRREICWGRENV